VLDFADLRDDLDVMIYSSSTARPPIAQVFRPAEGIGGERFANAHLIAAAPEMYEALMRVWSEALTRIPVGQSLTFSPALLAVQRALAKAEGK
jgi:hypothetical protein